MKKPQPYAMDRYGILNAHGDFWTPDTFNSMAEAQNHIDDVQQKNPRMKLDRHTVVRARVTVEAVE